MPEELGAFADAARAGEEQLTQRLAVSVAADQRFGEVLHGAYQQNLLFRRQLDSVEAEITQAAASWPALNTPAGARQFQQFLTAKTREIHHVIANAAADSHSRAAAVQLLAGQYRLDVARDRPPAAPAER